MKSVIYVMDQSFARAMFYEIDKIRVSCKTAGRPVRTET
jgi:hypothetical protein